MSFDFQRSMRSLIPYSLYPYDISRRNILEIYNDAWDTCEYIDNKSIIRSCEQELIKLDKIELQDFLQQFVSKPLPFSTVFTLNEQTVGIYTSCVLLQLIYVFCIPGQEEKIKLVKVNINKILHTWTERSRYLIYERYLSQRLKAKSNLTDKDLLTGQIDPQHEFELKLYYWAKFYDNGDSKEFLQQNIDYLVSNIERSIQEKNLQEEKRKIISCTSIDNGYWGYLCIKDDYKRCNGIITRSAESFIVGNNTKAEHEFCKVLLCLLNICDQKSTLTQSKIHNSEIHASPSFQSEEEGTTKNPCTVYKVRCVLENLLSTLAEDEISQVFNNYIYQMYAMQSEITPDDLCIGELDSCHEFKLKLCYWKTICRKRDYETCKKFIQLYPEFLVSHIEDVVQKNEKWKTFSPCTTLLCILNWNVYYQKTSTPLNFQDCSFTSEVNKTTKCSYTAYNARSILQKLLSTLSEDEIHTTFNDYLDQMYTMKSEIAEDVFCTGKIEPYLEFQLKLCYCTGKWSKSQVEFITKNTQFFLSMVEEVNKRNQLRMKFKMCQVLNIIMDAKICIRESMIHSLTNIFEDEDESLIRLQSCFEGMPYYHALGKNTIYIGNDENAYQMIECLLLFKTKLDNLSEHKVKMLTQYKDHIKGLLLSLLAIVLTKLSTSQINEVFYLYNETTCVSNPTIQLELAKTFLDISLNPNISQHKKSIMEYKIQPLLISNDSSRTVLPLTAEITHYAWEKLDHKRMINICINIVKTESKDINFLIYEGFFCSEKKAIENEVEMEKRSQETETLVLLMLLLITITSTGHHKSAKLKKYLTLKYEYATASLYLLWCSGDIEVHPGPSLNKKTLAHDSTIERRWIQNISPKILNLLPEHGQSKYKPTKKMRNDMENRKNFKTLMKTCLEEKVHVPKMYLAEINAWETTKYKLLHKLFVYRCEIETIIASLKDFLTSGGRTNDLTACNVSYATELKTNEIAVVLGKDQRPNNKSQLMAYIPGKIANILIKCAHGEDPDAKHDGLWDLFLKDWPTDIILFDPNNREKHSKKHPGQKLIPDQELVDILLTLPQVTIPQKYKEIVDAFRTMRKSQKDKSINKQHKAELCSTFKRITSLEKLDYALKNLWESGIFTEEVHNNLNKWWTTGVVDTTDNQNLSQVDIKDAEKKRRPHILMNISTKSLTLTVEQSDANSSQVSYDFPFSDECVPLKTMATIVHQTTIHKPSSDSYQKVTAEKYLTDSPKPDACPADNQINLIIIPSEALRVLNTYFPCDIYPDSQAILENDIKHQHEMSSQELALCSIHFDQQTFSTNQFSQWNQNIAIFGQPGHILCTPNQSTTNLNDISSATKDSQNLDFHMQVSPTSDMGSSDSISSVNSGNEEKDQINTSNGDQGQDQLTDSDYSSDSSNNCVSKTSLKKRKCIEEDRIDMKKRKIPSLKQDKKQSETTSHRKIDSSMDNSTTCNKDMELLLDYLDIDLDSFDIDDQTFDVEMNALGNEDKNLQVCDKDRNLMNDETQMSNKNTTVRAYDTNVSSDLEMFLQEMICGESEKMIQMKSYLSDV